MNAQSEKIEPEVEVDHKFDSCVDFFTIFISNIKPIKEEKRCRLILKKAIHVIISMQQLLEIGSLSKSSAWFSGLISCINIDPISDYFFVMDSLLTLFSTP